MKLSLRSCLLERAFHGTKKGGFRAFEHDMSGIGTHFGTEAAAIAAVNDLHEFEPGKGKIIEVELAIKNPLRMRDVEEWNFLEDVMYELNSIGIISDDRFKEIKEHMINACKDDISSCRQYYSSTWNMLRREIENAGYDSIVYKNENEDRGNDSWIVWNDSLVTWITTRAV